MKLNFMQSKLFLYDVRETPIGFSRVHNYEEFVRYISEKGLPDFISFDHDLGEGKSGYDCAKFLVKYCMNNQSKLPEFTVHSQNPVGKENIERLLGNFRGFQEK